MNATSIAQAIVDNGTQCRFIGLTTETTPKLKKSCPFRGVRKITKQTGLVNVNYAAAVDRRIAQILGVAESQVEYEAGETWYDHVTTEDGKTLPLVKHKDSANGTLSLQFFPQRSSSVYLDENDKQIDEKDLQEHFYARKPQPACKPQVRVFDLDNIKELRMGGQVLRAEDLQNTAVLT